MFSQMWSFVYDKAVSSHDSGKLTVMTEKEITMKITEILYNYMRSVSHVMFVRRWYTEI